MRLKISGYASPAGGPIRLKIGWPHDAENQGATRPHEPASWHRDVDGLVEALLPRLADSLALTA